MGNIRNATLTSAFMSKTLAGFANSCSHGPPTRCAAKSAFLQGRVHACLMNTDPVPFNCARVLTKPTRHMERSTYPWEVLHTSVRTPRKHWERGIPLKKDWKVIGRTFSLSPSAWVGQIFSLQVKLVRNSTRFPSHLRQSHSTAARMSRHAATF